MPEELKNVTVQVDSQTAERIAKDYITFKYVENFTCVLLIGGIIAVIVYGVKKFAENI